MRAVCILSILAVCFVVAFIFPCNAEINDQSGGSKRGIAILASSIGKDFPPEKLAEIVRQGKFSPLVIDWAWITFHWDKTDFAAVKNFIKLMDEQKVPVAAMYRPRFLSNPTVTTQMTKEGERSVDHAEICYSDAAARKWGISWGEKILEKCPTIKEIIIYNPTNTCRCPACISAAKKGSHSSVRSFLAGAKFTWQKIQPEVKLGVVYMPDAGFWKSVLNVVDVAHPYLRIKDDVDAAQDIANVKKLQAITTTKMGSCLGKITWEEGAKVSIEKLKNVDESAAKAGISYFFWTFDTLIDPSLYDTKAVATLPGLGDLLDKKATSPKLDLKTVEKLIEQMLDPTDQFASMNSLTESIKSSDDANKPQILGIVISAMNDNTRAFTQRFQCCYVVSGSRYEPGVPDLISILQQDENEMMRAVAAEALADFPKNTAAHEALLQASKNDTSTYVQEVLSRRLVTEGSSIKSSSDSIKANPPNELAPTGAPQPPPGPAKPVAEALPWPFAGDYKSQSIFNNYQQATDIYIHCGLDFIHPAGTPVNAVSEGYVAVIATNYPEWDTHYFFVITPKKNDNTGWCYTHLDPKTFTFKEGDHISKGQPLGSLVDFSVGKQSGVAHLHLHYVNITKNEGGKVDVHSLLDPLYFFDWKDTVAPIFKPLYFLSAGTTNQFEPDTDGTITVKGKVDILSAITDSAYPEHAGNLGVPVVMLSISDGKHTMQTLVLDHRGDVGNETITQPLYLTYEERKAYLNPDSFPRYQLLRVTKTDGDGKIGPEDATKCWDTTEKDSKGNPVWPNGEYSVNVYAWDIAGNRGGAGAKVKVMN